MVLATISSERLRQYCGLNGNGSRIPEKRQEADFFVKTLKWIGAG
jgi:hypothetical protein